MRESGKTASAFSDSQYAVSEDKSPNVHTRQVKLQMHVIVVKHKLRSPVAAHSLNTPSLVHMLSCRRRVSARVQTELPVALLLPSCTNELWREPNLVSALKVSKLHKNTVDDRTADHNLMVKCFGHNQWHVLEYSQVNCHTKSAMLVTALAEGVMLCKQRQH